MKRLFVLVAFALVLSFASGQVGWAAPAQHHPQQQKAPANKDDKRHKSDKRPNTVKQHKPAAKEKVMAPANHSRSQIKSTGRHAGGPAGEGVKAPPNHTRSQVKNNSHQPHKVAADRIKPAENRGRPLVQKDAPRHGPPRDGHRDTLADQRFVHRHNSHQRWPDSDVWHRRFRDWPWLSTHRAHNFDACYDRHGKPVYISYEPLDGDYLYSLEERYGECHYRERHHHHGAYGWCYYWFGGGNVIALFVGDDGYSQTFIWQRDEAESQAVALGILTPDLRVVYGRYDAAMPPDLAADYARDVLWATVDDDDA